MLMGHTAQATARVCFYAAQATASTQNKADWPREKKAEMPHIHVNIIISSSFIHHHIILYIHSLHSEAEQEHGHAAHHHTRLPSRRRITLRRRSVMSSCENEVMGLSFTCVREGVRAGPRSWHVNQATNHAPDVLPAQVSNSE